MKSCSLRKANKSLQGTCSFKYFVSLAICISALFIIAGCAAQSDPARNVETYLTARANRDTPTISRLLCADLEPQIDQEISTFEGVSGVKIEGMSCRRDGDTDRVVCAGKIVADYGTEKNEFPLGAYRIKQEDNEWKWCGETN